MDFDWTTLTEALGWREMVIGAIGLLAVYVFFVFLRLVFLKPKASEGLEEDFDDPYVEVPAPPAPAAAPQAAAVGNDSLRGEPSRADSLRREPVAKRYAEHRHLDVLEHEISDLRDEMKNMRTDLRLLRTDLQQQLDRLKAAQNTSPLYSDAMQMALLGHDAVTIADRCSIAVAEAELVVALANSRVD